MQLRLAFITFFSINFLFAQEASEVYLFDFIEIDSTTNSYELKNPINLSENPGFYDNQPSFLNDGRGVLFSSTRNEQTDIVLYDIEKNEKRWLTDTEYSEYSPLQTPNKKFFSAVRLEQDGTQLLWYYSLRRKNPKVLIENLKVGYHVWFNDRIVVSFVLGDPATLEVSNLKFKIKYPIEKNIGRSLQIIPNSELISYISLEHDEPEIYAINPINSEKKYVADALPGSQDLVWTPNGSIIMGKDDSLYMINPKKDKEWKKIASIKEFDLNGITRLAISPLGNKIVLVVNEKEIETSNTEN